jgi:diacylglycerol O-acyltransferase / wax synthase
VPGGLDRPSWIEDPDFDLSHHLFRRAVPSPGGPSELAWLAADILSRPLDRDRPLWEMHVVEGVQGGLTGVVAKIHHAAIDGISGVELTCNLMDFSPEPEAVSPPAGPWVPERAPTLVDVGVTALAGIAQRGPALLHAAVATTGMVVRVSRRREHVGTSPTRPFSAPMTSLNGRLGKRRAVGMVVVDRGDVDQVRAITGCSCR